MTTTPQQAGVPDWTTGWRLHRSLVHAHMTIEQMAEEIGVSRSSVSRWINDRAAPRTAYLRLWALRTGVPYAWLLDGTVPDDQEGSRMVYFLTRNIA